MAKATPYITRQGDMIDLICFRRYGNGIATLQAVLDANPHLADRGPVLPEGLTIWLPEDVPQPPKQRAGTINLWD